MKYLLHLKKKSKNFPISYNDLIKAREKLNSQPCPIENRFLEFNNEKGRIRIATDHRGKIKSIEYIK